jgi:hypothetical protein
MILSKCLDYHDALKMLRESTEDIMILIDYKIPDELAISHSIYASTLTKYLIDLTKEENDKA